MFHVLYKIFYLCVGERGIKKYVRLQRTSCTAEYLVKTAANSKLNLGMCNYQNKAIAVPKVRRTGDNRTLFHTAMAEL